MRTGDEPQLSDGQSADEPRLSGQAMLMHAAGLLDHDDEHIRTRAAVILADAGDGRAFETLLAVLDDEQPALHARAADALGKLGDQRAFAPLLAVVLESQHTSARYAAARSLMRLDEDAALEAIFAQLAADAPRERWTAVEALGVMKTPTAFSAIRAALADEHRYVRRAAVTAMVEYGGPRAVDALLEALDDPAFLVQNAVVGALGTLGDQRAIEPLLTRIDRPMLRRPILRALAELKAPEAVEPFIKLLERDHDEFNQQIAVDALGAIGDERAIPVLVKVVERATRRDPEQLHLAAAILTDASDRAYPSNDTGWLIYHVMSALRRIGTPYALATLTTLMEENTR